MNRNINVNPLLCQRADINPYRYALSLIISRIKWDLNYKSWLSSVKLRAMQNIKVGKKCIILCNGPSLKNVDFRSIQESGIDTFGLNKINLMFDRSDFRPTYIVCVNSYVLEQNKQFYNTTNIPLFVSSTCSNFITRRPNVTYFHVCNQAKFARNCCMSLQSGFTVTYVAMQLAFHIGYKEVALVGCDHSFATKGPSNMAVSAVGSDQSHFDSRYFDNGQVWQLPDLNGSEFYYSMAKNVYEAFGRNIVNCTEGGALNLFKRQKLAEFVH